MQLGLGVMKASGARPSVRASVDGSVAVLGDDPAKLTCRQIERLLPGDLDKRLTAATIPPTIRPALEPTFANGRTVDPDTMLDPIE